jgi:hypothetical protein
MGLGEGSGSAAACNPFVNVPTGVLTPTPCCTSPPPFLPTPLPLPTASCGLLPEALLAASPDFQTKLGYPLPPPNGANLSTASKANAQKYNTLSLVLEQPFKDTTGGPTATQLPADNRSQGQRAKPLQHLLEQRSSTRPACVRQQRSMLGL